MISAERKEQIGEDLYTTAKILLYAFLLGWCAVLFKELVEIGSSSSVGFRHLLLDRMFSDFLWSLAWLAAGFLFGFLFGVPKVVSQPGTPVLPAVPAVIPPGGTPDTEAPQTRLKVNTNLEEISDWLTKVLVGATLTQILKIPGAISRAASFMADASLGDGGSVGFQAAILIYYGSLGFLSGYILTRMFFSRAFALAD